jgi:hypothetical protein
MAMSEEVIGLSLASIPMLKKLVPISRISLSGKVHLWLSSCFLLTPN